MSEAPAEAAAPDLVTPDMIRIGIERDKELSGSSAEERVEAIYLAMAEAQLNAEGELSPEIKAELTDWWKFTLPKLQPKAFPKGSLRRRIRAQAIDRASKIAEANQLSDEHTAELLRFAVETAVIPKDMAEVFRAAPTKDG